MKRIIHINQHVIRSNHKTGKREPPIVIRSYKGTVYTKQANIVDSDGKVLATIHYEPDHPLSCGARCWISTEYNVVCA